MAINPFRIGELQIPANPKPVAIDLSPLGAGIASLGAGIGQYRRQQAIGSILADSTDENGNLDPIKAATNMGRAGYGKEAQDLLEVATKKQIAQSTADYHTQSIKQTGEYQRGMLSARERELERQQERDKQTEEYRQRQLDIQQKTLEQGKVLDFTVPNPLGLGPDTRFRRLPDGTTIQVYPPPAGGTPAPAAPAPPPAAPGPRSELPTDFNARFAGGPEEAPPYRVAALGDVPVPGAAAAAPPPPAERVAQAAPVAPAVPARDAGLQKLEQQYGPDAAGVFRDILDYKRGLPQDHALKEKYITVARQIDPEFDPTEFERRQKDLNRPSPHFTPDQITKLQTEGGKGQQATAYLDTFRPEFAGPKFTGGVLMQAGNRLPESVSSKIDPNLPQAAAWWRGYENFKNDVRNAQFGATLTAGEAAAFNRANITPELDPKQAQLLLERQKAIVIGALKRTASGLVTEGYNPKTIAEAYGMDLKDLGVTAEPPEKRGAAKVSTKDQANSRIDQARAAYQRDPSKRDEIIRRLQDMGVPNAATVLGQ